MRITSLFVALGTATGAAAVSAAPASAMPVQSGMQVAAPAGVVELAEYPAGTKPPVVRRNRRDAQKRANNPAYASGNPPPAIALPPSGDNSAYYGDSSYGAPFYFRPLFSHDYTPRRAEYYDIRGGNPVPY